jgi:endonuclease/exonuclease/phosphatase (EEP) superfamily protein YafD
MKSLIVAAASFGGILLFLLASASANTALFARHYPWLLALNAIVALSLLALIAWQLACPLARTPGAGLRLTPQAAPDADVRPDGGAARRADLRRVGPVRDQEYRNLVRRARREGPRSGLNLGRSALDSLLEDLAAKGRPWR